jgi:V-type H+-transporting ATPase subunit a
MSAAAMTIAAPRLADSRGMVATLLGFRYFLLLMALCGISNDLIYNESFGLPVNLFDSRWTSDGTSWKRTGDSVYPVGFDPVWMFKDNELIFTNSMKMKISVVMGVAQMIFGMFLQLIKEVRRRDWIQLRLG